MKASPFVWGLVFCLMLVGLGSLLGCGVTMADLQAINPKAATLDVSCRPSQLPNGVNLWATQAPSGHVATDEQKDDLLSYAEVADVFIQYKKSAPRENALIMAENYGLTCPNVAEEQPSDSEVEDEDCSARTSRMFLGDVSGSPKVYVKDKCMTPKAISARERAISDVEKDLKKLGAQYGTIFGEAEGAITSVNTALMGTLSYQIKTGKADVVNDIYLWLANKLDTLPPIPTYEDPDFAAAAQSGFESGFGTGFDAAIARARKLDLAAEAALALSGNVGTLAESVGAKALRAALTRVRAMPIFIPGTAGGAGFFLRVQKTLPKPPPANANAPSIPPGIAAPPVTALPPFGKLSRAAEFGIQSYTKMLNALKGTGLSAHHLIEQRLAPYLQGDTRLNLTVAVTEAEHQAFTNAWRNEIAYGAAGTHKVTTDMVNAAARKIYATHPAILKALNL